MNQFEVARQEWLAEPFPEGSPLDDLDEIHSSLHYWDTFVSDCVIPFERDGSWNELAVDVPTGLRGLVAQIEEARLRAPESARLLLNRYERFANLLLRVFAAAERAAGGGP